MALELRTYQQWVDWRRTVNLALSADMAPMIEAAIAALPGSPAVPILRSALAALADGWAPSCELYAAQCAHFRAAEADREEAA